MESNSVIAICCVRMNSSRLPGKALAIYDEVSNKPNVECIVDRALLSRHSPLVVVATSDSIQDDPIETWFRSYSKNKNVALFRGDLDNVTKRMNDSIVKFSNGEKYVWRLMADCPLIDVGLMDWRIDVIERNDGDVLVPLSPEPTYAAQGSVWSRVAWDHCVKMSSGSLLEHPGEYIWENLSQFRAISDPGPENIYYQPIRTELDTPEDLEFFRQVWKWYVNYDPNPTTKKALEYLSARPDITSINAHIGEKTHTTYLHGHHRARKLHCENEACRYEIATKVNNRLDIRCPKCGQSRSFYP